MPEPQKMKDMMGDLEENSLNDKPTTPPGRLEFLLGQRLFNSKNLDKIIEVYLHNQEEVHFRFYLSAYNKEPHREKGVWVDGYVPVMANYNLSKVGFVLAGPGLKSSIPALAEDSLTVVGVKDFEITFVPPQDAKYLIRCFNYSGELKFTFEYSTGIWVLR